MFTGISYMSAIANLTYSDLFKITLG